MSICLYASEISVITGHNKFKKISDLIIEIWQRNFPNDFKNSLQQVEEIKQCKFIPEKKDNEIINEISKKRNLDIMKNIDTSVKNINDLHQNKTLIIKSIEHKQIEDKNIINNFIDNIDSLINNKKELDEKKKEIIEKFDENNKKLVSDILNDVNKIKDENNNKIIIKVFGEICKKENELIKKNIESFGNRNFGTKNETNVIKIFEQTNNQKVIIDTSFHKKMLFDYENIKWFIGGKIDGLLEDGTIIEVKNRMYKLFYTLREYENIQIQSYMYIFNTMNSILIESINKKINIINVEFNESEYYLIKNKIKSFATLFHKCLSDINYKIIILTGTEDEKHNLLNYNLL